MGPPAGPIGEPSGEPYFGFAPVMEKPGEPGACWVTMLGADSGPL